MRQRIYLLSLLGLMAGAIQAEEPDTEPRFVSPAKKWEYRIVNGDTVALARAGEEKPAIELSQGEGLKVESGKLVWAPDSRRFAFNLRAGGKYY
jgi:hypothetical protein